MTRPRINVHTLLIVIGMILLLAGLVFMG